MESEVVLIAEELSHAVELTLNPTVAHEARNQAYTACESFKENSPWCAQAGLLLATGAQYSAVVKHFGLQLMEHTVKYRWTQITQTEKLFIKENAMKLLYLGGWETGHLNDALARVIVEMIKREWPQQWQTLLNELSDACARGHVHTQIVLHIFLRLVEDVATLQTLEQNQRRKDIYQALTSNMAEIFAFFMRLTELHVQEFREKTAAGDYVAANSNGRVVQVVLLTLTGFVEWVSTNHIVANNGRLLQMLCILLQDSVFQVSAAECLLQVVNRKGPTKERKPLLIMLSEDAISCIHRAALASINSVDENSYLFLKKLSQVQAGLGQLLASLWGHITNSESWMGVYLESVLLLTSHPSLSVAQSAVAAWLAMVKHEQISKHPRVTAAVPAWLQAAAPKLLKVTYGATQPGINDATAYASIDYDCEQEFNVFFNRFRTEILDSFRYSMSAAPLVTWAFVEQWTDSALDKVDSCGEDINIQHPVHIEWEALSQVLDVVLSRLLTCSPRPAVPPGLRLLQRCVNCCPRSPLLLSLLLSLLSALAVFLSCCSQQLQGPTVAIAGAELLPQVLDKIFTALVYEGTAVEDRNSRNVKNVRRHAAGLLVKLASKYPLLLLPQFSRLHEATRAALQRLQPGAVESVAAQEALLVLGNQLACFHSHAALVSQVLGDCSSRFAELTPHFTSAASLARLLGLDADSATAASERCSTPRRALLHCLALLLAVVRRSAVPSDPDKATRGGYSAGTSPSGNPLWRNPCAAHVLPLLPGVLALLRALHALHAAPAVLHAEHARCLAPPPADTRALLGLRDDVAEPPSQPARLQAAVHALHEHACHLIGASAASLGREFYTCPELGPQLAAALAAPAAALPAHWLRRVLRAALKPLAAHTAPPHVRALLPAVDALAPRMLAYLSQRWEYITALHESGQLEDAAGSESQEVLEDVLVRHLTREYLDFLKIALLDVGPVTESSNCDMEEDTTNVAPTRVPEQVSEIGGYILSQPAATPILHTILRALTWLDATSSLRACALVVPVLRACVAARRVTAGEARGALAAELQALRAHGQHDANQAACLLAALQIYEILRPMFPDIVSVLHSIPDVDAHDLNRLDEKLAANTNKPSKIDKSKRDLFKKITSRLIGRNVGQLFKKEVYILDLPTMHVAKEKPRSAVDAPEGANLEALFANRAPT